MTSDPYIFPSFTSRQEAWDVIRVYCRLYVDRVIKATECMDKIIDCSGSDERLLQRANREIRYMRRCQRNGSHRPCKWSDSFREKAA